MPKLKLKSKGLNLTNLDAVKKKVEETKKTGLTLKGIATLKKKSGEPTPPRVLKWKYPDDITTGEGKKSFRQKMRNKMNHLAYLASLPTDKKAQGEAQKELKKLEGKVLNS